MRRVGICMDVSLGPSPNPSLAGCPSPSPTPSPAPSPPRDIDMVGEVAMHEHLTAEAQIEAWLTDADVMALYRVDPEFEELQMAIDTSFVSVRDDKEATAAYTVKQRLMGET